MESLVRKLKKHVEWKLETRKYDSPKSVYEEVVSVFRELTSKFEQYSIEGDSIVSFKHDENDMSANLYVDISLEGIHNRREIIFHPHPSAGVGNFKFSINIRIPDTGFKPAFRELAFIEVKSNESDINFFDNAEEMRIMNVQKFTRNEFEQIVESVILFDLDENLLNED